jgi:tetratricopeptide (TPR) repeat protein
MKINIKTVLTLLPLFCSGFLFAQNKNSAAGLLLKQGIALHDAKKFNEAIAKYDEALKLEPDNFSILYEKGFSLFSSGKTDQAVPILEKVAASNKEPGAYDVLGSIFDDKNECEKAAKYYQAGIDAFPNYQRLRFNLSICYFRQNKYVEAEQASVKAIKLDPTHASSQRIYALATYEQGKHLNSLMAWCSFLLMEPQSERSVEACKYLKHILYYGIKDSNITLTANKDNQADNLKIAIAATSGLALANKINGALATSLDSLILPLAYILKMGNQPKDAATPTFFSKFFADYFKALSATEYITAFSRYITLSTYRSENVAWLKAHEPEVKGLSAWVNSTKRETE